MEWWNRKDADNFFTLEVVIVLVVGDNARQKTAIGLNAFTTDSTSLSSATSTAAEKIFPFLIFCFLGYNYNGKPNILCLSWNTIVIPFTESRARQLASNEWFPFSMPYQVDLICDFYNKVGGFCSRALICHWPRSIAELKSDHTYYMESVTLNWSITVRLK